MLSIPLKSTRATALTWCICVLSWSAAATGQEPAAASASELQALDILAGRCGRCHVGKTSKGGFDLSTRDRLLESGYVKAGDSGASWLLALIRHEEEPAMPLKGEKLPAAEIDAIARWIDAGATYEGAISAPGDSDKDANRQGEAFARLQPQRPPIADADGWSRTPVDQFILDRLNEGGVDPSVSAPPERLIRRLYFDLVGLPPTPEQVDAFLANPTAEAYDALVDQLLESPHYGERWARHWLDIVRFAESHGFEHDYDRPSAYHYRDFVIRALNQGMPYDRFVRWQVAGDELAPDDPMALMATGFLAAGVHNTQITANQVEKERYDELDDIVNTLGTAFLGLTVGCARCHDHKFDPITTTDYYKLVANFATTVRSELDVQLDAERYRRDKQAFDREIQPHMDALAEFEEQELARRFAQWLQEDFEAAKLADGIPTWAILRPLDCQSRGYKDTPPAELHTLADDSVLASGPSPIEDEYTIVVETPLPRIAALRLEAMSDGSLPLGGPGRAGNGNFALGDVSIQQTPLQGDHAAVDVELPRAVATFQQNEGHLSVAASIDEDRRTGWAVDHGGIGDDHAAVFYFANPVESASGSRLTIRLKFHANAQHTLGRFRLSVSPHAEAQVGLGDDLPQQTYESIAAVAARTPSEVNDSTLSEAERDALQRLFAIGDADWLGLRSVIDELEKNRPRPTTARVLVCSEGLTPLRLSTQGDDFFEETFILKRGDPNQKVELVEAGFLQTLSSRDASADRWSVDPPERSRTSFRRAGLANWLTDVEQGAGHLLARVIVNRLWQHHFGRGLVATPSDFGMQGDVATHPELLDWLAVQLVQDGWRLKPIHRLIVTSAAYRQDSVFDAEKASADPDNRLLWRQVPRRLEGEIIRDAMLAVSGQLDSTMFGPGSRRPDHTRRSIYFFLKRSQMPRFLTQFDGPDALGGLPARATTTVAPQSLLLVNNEHVWNWSRAFADRLESVAHESPAAAIELAYRLALGRRPDEIEMQVTLAFLEQQTARYETTGEEWPEKLAWADFCQSMFCLNEFVYVD